MMKNKLPKVFVNPIDIRNINQGKSNVVDSVDIESLFLDDGYAFNRVYYIYLKDGRVIESSIISNLGNSLLTIDGDKINISDIKRLVKKK